MQRPNHGAMGVWATVVLLAASALGDAAPARLKIGDTLPLLAGKTVTDKPLELPAAAQGKVAVVIFSFSRAGGRDAKNWAQHLSKDDPQLLLYTAIFLESVPRLFRSIAVSEIRSGMPPAMLDRTLLLYQQQSSWEQILQSTDEKNACVVLLGRDGHIRWISSGPFAEPAYEHLREQLRNDAGRSAEMNDFAASDSKQDGS